MNCDLYDLCSVDPSIQRKLTRKQGCARGTLPASSLRVEILGPGIPILTGGSMKIYRVLLPIICAFSANGAFAQSSFPANLNTLCTSQVPLRGAPNLVCNDCHVANRAVNTGRPAYLAYLPSGTTAQKLALCLAATTTPTPTPRPTVTPTPRPVVTPTPAIKPTPRSRPPRRSREKESDDHDD